MRVSNHGPTYTIAFDDRWMLLLITRLGLQGTGEADVMQVTDARQT